MPHGLAARACVGLAAARYTACRLRGAGELDLLSEPGRRPAVLGIPTQMREDEAGADLAALLTGWR